MSTDYGNAVLYEDTTNSTFGIAKVKKHLGFLYSYDGGAYGYFVEEGRPFAASGYGDKESIVVGVNTAENSNIKYISVGNHLPEISPFDRYDLDITDVKERPDLYQLQEVEGSYALFVLKGDSEDNWTIRAFDHDGNLIADKLFAGEIRNIDW